MVLPVMTSVEDLIFERIFICFLVSIDAYEGRQMNISWHEKNPIEYKPQSIQIEGYKLTSIETSSDVVHYVTGGKL